MKGMTNMKEGGYAWHIREQLCLLLTEDADGRSGSQTNSHLRKATARILERIVSPILQLLDNTEYKSSKSNGSKGQRRS